MRLKSALGAAFLATASSLVTISPASAATVTATGTNPAVCNQEVGNSANVTAVRLAGGDCVVEFKNVGSVTWTPSSSATLVRVLVVAGGGGGGAHVGSGGGAGGLIDTSTISITQDVNVSITVGAGGAGSRLNVPSCSNPSSGITGEERTGTGGFCNDASRATRSRDGGNSSFSGVGISTLTSVGGGGGGSWNYFYPRTGGSGAGGSSATTGAASATAGQGNSGGAYAGTYGTGGGGGYMGAGGSGTSNAGGKGGTGYTTATLTGASRSFAGGGGGGTHEAGGSGGTALHGGGAGSAGTTIKAANGSANTGGGGGGSGNNNAFVSEGGDGGSGIVIVRYIPDTTAPTFTNSANFSIAENTATSTNAASITVSESSTVSLNASGDHLLFTVVSSDSTTARIRFLSIPNFESPLDSGGNNVYDLSVRATDAAGNAANQSITITVTNVNEAPTITTASSAATHAVSQAENISSVITYTGSDVDAGTTLTWSISGTDASFFAINSSSGVLTFISAPDFESAADNGADNTYVVTITLSDGSLTDTQTLTVSITNANESSSINAPTTSGAINKGIATTISITVNTAGKVRFFVGNKRITNCLARTTSGSYPTFTATCSWRPAVTGRQSLTARVTPTDNTFSASSSPRSEVFVLRRGTVR